MAAYRIINRIGKANILDLDRPSGRQTVHVATQEDVFKIRATRELVLTYSNKDEVSIDLDGLELQDALNLSPYLYKGSIDELLDKLNNQYLAATESPFKITINSPDSHPAVDGIVTFETGVSYYITQSIDWGDAIFVIEDGCNIIKADNNRITIGSSNPVLSGGYTAIFNFLGASKLEFLTLDAYDSPIPAFDMDATVFSPIEWLNVNIQNSLNGGSIRNFGNGFFEKCGVFNFANLAFVGECQTLAFTSTKADAKRLDPVTSNPLPCIIFDTTMKVNRRLRAITCVGDSNNGGSIFEFRIPDTNIGTERFIFEKCEFTLSNGSQTFSGIDETSSKAAWSGNIGMPNTYVGGEAKTSYLAGQEPVTTIVQNIYSSIQASLTGGAIAGAEVAVNNQRLFDAVDDNGSPLIVYKGDREYTFSVVVSWTTTVPVNRVIGLRLLIGEADDNNNIITPATPVPSAQRKITTNGAGRPETVTVTFVEKLKKNDFIAFEGANFTSSSDIETIDLEITVQFIA